MLQIAVILHFWRQCALIIFISKAVLLCSFLTKRKMPGVEMTKKGVIDFQTFSILAVHCLWLGKYVDVNVEQVESNIAVIIMWQTTCTYTSWMLQCGDSSWCQIYSEIFVHVLFHRNCFKVGSKSRILKFQASEAQGYWWP